MTYYVNVWDPILILLQICTMQSIFYVCSASFAGVLNWLVESPLTLDQIFRARYLTLSQFSGQITILIFTTTAIICALSLVLVVERSRKCLDFAFTIYFNHFLFCCFYAGFPKTFMWWIVNICCLFVTSLLSEYLCRKKEMREIIVGARALSV
eukprot:TRINITY_DN1574_c0_g1_i1.p1 TRINITY_DN1574_c0_g1~~TRINITY_DN1574_c0_g1_i1.p1  ORF type:complete len:153 (+),score=47.09 TRINITY_DN1574_c0_g1_i1:256-714(+)